MEKTKKMICILCLICLLLPLLCGCKELDEMRAKQAFYDENGNILWNGAVYKQLPQGEYFQPHTSYENRVYVTEPDVPVLLHVNDPEDFWDASAVPVWAAAQGWLYDESYVNNEEQYRQMEAILKRHPKIKFIFAHMYFMSAQLPRLAALLA